METEPLASVIVAFRKDPRIERCIQSLLDQTIPRDKYEVIIVESGSSVSEDFGPKLGVRRVYLPEGTLPAARNLGVRSARADIVLFTDSDCVIDYRWVESMISSFAQSAEDVAGIGGIIERYKPATPVELWGANIVSGQQKPNYLPILPLPYLATANAGYRKKLLLEVGGFDEELLSANDVDLCYKLGLNGYKMKISTGSIVFHENRKTVRGHFRRFFHYGVYQCLLFKKYRHISKRRFLITKYPFACLAHALRILPIAIIRLSKRDPAPFWTSLLLLVEGVGLIAGGLSSSVRQKVLYI